MSIKLVTVDPVTMVQFGYAAACAADPGIELVGQASGEVRLRELVRGYEPDVVTVDAAVPGALPLAAELREERPRLGVVLTGPAEDSLLLRSLQAGLSAYLPRTGPVELLMAAVRHAAVAPASFTAPDLAAVLARRRSSTQQLSPREEEILRELHAGGSLAAIALRMRLAESTVRTYVSRLYDKLGVHSREQALAATRR
ncbi:response regulator transcription factor [Catellatospora sp. KI3]|uniref:LuxR C-terminal-related transcriptional regulator n=1 Tax=Catellatospora sp. KI3 TaxID=3041620 RepID=UPI0024826F23|nr:response regulator transcription factor [Catellatospora sp. KI3]MDI1461712.1 response regulator transcription factor [Catellatospora sp. KI3]